VVFLPSLIHCQNSLAHFRPFGPKFCHDSTNAHTARAQTHASGRLLNTEYGTLDSQLSTLQLSTPLSAMAFTATKDLMLPATVTGSWPRPRWYSVNMWGRPLDTAMMDPWFREQFTDAHAIVVS